MNHFMGKGCRRQLKWPDHYLPSIFYFETETTSLWGYVTVYLATLTALPDPPILA